MDELKWSLSLLLVGMCSNVEMYLHIYIFSCKFINTKIPFHMVSSCCFHITFSCCITLFGTTSNCVCITLQYIYFSETFLNGTPCDVTTVISLHLSFANCLPTTMIKMTINIYTHTIFCIHMLFLIYSNTSFVLSFI